ncbi:hypothetical protein H1R20_g1610, partial [Candolleomyces eurysporus]
MQTKDDAIRAELLPNGMNADVGRNKIAQKNKNTYHGGRHNQPIHLGDLINDYTFMSRTSSQTSTSSSLSEEPVEYPVSAKDKDIIQFLDAHYFTSKDLGKLESSHNCSLTPSQTHQSWSGLCVCNEQGEY